MPTTESLTVTFNGVNDVPMLAGQDDAVWYGSQIELYSLWYSGPKDKFVFTGYLTGTDWKIKYLRAASDDNKMILKDLDDGAGRDIRFLELGYNSDVDLISTRARYVFGWDGEKHDVQLGSGTTYAVNLFALENTVKTGSGWVSSIFTGGTDTIVISDAGAGSISTGNGNAKVTTNGGWVDSIVTRDGNDTISVGSGNAGSVHTRDGNDTVDATSGWIEFVSTGAGNDVVKLGANSGGMTVRLGSGNDIVKLREMTSDQGVQIQGQGGTDTIDFSKFTTGVTFTLDGRGIWQNVTDPDGLDGLGWYSETGIDNITGTNKNDTLTGDENANLLNGRGGHDQLTGGKGNDKLVGGGGNDRLFGGNGKDTLEGGKGKDTLEGGKGNDTLRGQGGADVFVFGAGSGTDKVKDFADGTDMLRLVGHTGGFNDLTISDSGANLSITHDGGVIILTGAAGTVLTAADFDFV